MTGVTCKGSEAAQLARAWLELEYFKRELRGLPRLRAVDMMSTLKRLPNAQRPTPADAPVEISATTEGSKESIKHSFSETVTAPPTPDAQEGRP